MYRERPARTPGAVVWERSPEKAVTVAAPRSASAPADDRPAAVRVLPDGCMDLIWTGELLLVAGPDTEAHLVGAAPEALAAGVRFAPGDAPVLLGLPACELRDRRLPLADLWPAGRVRRLTERVAAAPDPAAALDEVSAGLLRRTGRADPAVHEVAGLMRSGAPVGGAAGALGLSERQLHRRCLSAFGYGPKTLARILRLCRALDLARTGLPYALVAARCGYADQAHLARDVRALTGVPLGTLLPGP